VHLVTYWPGSTKRRIGEEKRREEDFFSAYNYHTLLQEGGWVGGLEVGWVGGWVGGLVGGFDWWVGFGGFTNSPPTPHSNSDSHPCIRLYENIAAPIGHGPDYGNHGGWGEEENKKNIQKVAIIAINVDV